jgi:hypothetical protein
MALVDRKVSLPGDFDIKVAYIYPTPIDSISSKLTTDMSAEDVRIYRRVINIIHKRVSNINFMFMLLVYKLNIYFYTFTESIQQEFSIKRQERQIL